MPRYTLPLFLSVLLLIVGTAEGEAHDSSYTFICGGAPNVHREDSIRAKPIGRRKIPTQGTCRVVALFAKFSNEDPTQISLPSYAQDLFDPDLPGSFTHFYHEMSLGKLTIEGVVLPTYYASDRPASKYPLPEKKTEGYFGTFNREVLEKADQDVDFGRFDNDGPDSLPNSGDDDGYVDYLFIVVQSSPLGFLPGHATGIAELGLKDEFVTNDPAPSGYIKIASNRGATQRVRGFAHAVGVMAHEFGHALGLPDLYDTSYKGPEDDSAGIGNWGLMARGVLGWHGDDGPVPFCAWSREQLGWANVVEITEDVVDQVLTDVATTGTVYKIPLGERGSYYLLENRQSTQSYYDHHIPQDGLLIWHIQSKTGNGDERNKRVDLVCADGLYLDRGYPDGAVAAPDSGRDNLDFWAHDDAYRIAHTGNLGDATDVFDGIRFTAFTPYTNPSSRGGVWIEHIRPKGTDRIADIQPVKWAGSITDNMIWEGPINVVGDIVIQKGATLTIRPGTVVRFAPTDALQSGTDPDHCEVDVFGVLRIGGYGEDLVRLTAEGKGTWVGVRLHEETASISIEADQIRIEDCEYPKGIFWSEHPDATGPEIFQCMVQDNGEAGNGDGHLNPGETVQLSFVIGNWTATTFRTLYVTLSTDDPFVNPGRGAFSTTLSYRYVSPGRTNAPRRSSASLTAASDCPNGHRIPFTVTFKSGTTTWTEPFFLPVTGTDRTPPWIIGGLAIPNHVPVNKPMTLTIAIEEPGAVIAQAEIFRIPDLVSAEEEDARPPDSVRVAVIPLRDDGTHGDRKAGDRRYSGTWVPGRSGDFLAFVQATDVYGNQGEEWGPVRFDSYGPFVRTADILLYASSMGGELLKYKKRLKAIGVSFDAWDHQVRGLVDASTLSLYTHGRGAVLWASFHGLTNGKALPDLAAYLDAGGRLFIGVEGVWNALTIGGSRDNAFYRDYIHGESVQILRSPHTLNGIPDNPITRDLSLRFWRRVFESPVPIEPARSLFTTSEGNPVGLYVDTGAYRLVHLGFPMINIDLKDQSSRIDLLQRVLQWLLDPAERTKHDVAITSMVSPGDISDKAPLSPEVVLQNLGTYDERDLPVFCRIEKDHSPVFVDTCLLSVPAGQSTPVTFNPWTPPDPGTYEITIVVDLPKDEDPDNNRLSRTVWVPTFADRANQVGVDSNGYGVACGDYDRDGQPDLFVTHRNQPNALYHNQGDGTFIDVTPQAGLHHVGKGRGAAVGDYDNDGDLDLYVVNEGPNVFYQNQGDGTFIDVTTQMGLGDPVKGRSVAVGDYDRDGDLDLYVTNVDGPNRLYANQGDRFVDRASWAGVADSSASRGALFFDYDNDGDLDIYVVNDGPNRLYRNSGDGSFSDVAEAAGVADARKGIGVEVGDYDNDGDLDIYVANDGPNRLYRNNGDGSFVECSDEAGVDDPQNTSTAAFFDYDNDGDLDLYLVNYRGANVLYRNDGQGIFTDRTYTTHVGDSQTGYGLGVLDYDQDGYLDMYVANSKHSVLYHNNGSGAHWLTVDLQGSLSNRDGIGARVQVVAGGVSQIREVRAGSGYLSQHSLPVEFGLGPHAVADSILITWPSGVVDLLRHVRADTTLIVVEGSAPLVTDVREADLPRSIPSSYALGQNVPNPFNFSTHIAYNLSETCEVNLVVYTITGKKVATLVSRVQEAGHYAVTWDGGGVGSGVYLYRLKAGTFVATRQMVRIR